MPVGFQGDALSDAEKNVIKKAVTGGIIPYKLEYDNINISVRKDNGYYEIEVFAFRTNVRIQMSMISLMMVI